MLTLRQRSQWRATYYMFDKLPRRTGRENAVLTALLRELRLAAGLTQA